MPEKIIGFLSLNEALPNAVIERINSSGVREIRAQQCEFSYMELNSVSKYSLIVDRVSHLIPFYRPILKHAILQGTYVINNPFIIASDDKFYNYSLAAKRNVRVPKTVCLPSVEFPYGVTEGDLGNLKTEIDWDPIFEYIKFPAILKPYNGFGKRDVYFIKDRESFFKRYYSSGENVMLLQEYINYDHYIRCFVIGKEHILPVKYDPDAPFGGKQYIVTHNHLTPEVGMAVIEGCKQINEALGYDMNSVEFAIKDGVPYAVDFMNPIPDTEPERISEEYFQWIVEKLAETAIEYVVRGKKTAIPERSY